jgi:hypothetical protein
MNAPRICLITPGHLSSTPRLVKEANTLHAAGFSVRVVAADHFPAVRPLDESILAHAPWTCARVPLGSRPAYLARRLVQIGARRLVARTARPSPRLALWAHQPLAFRLAAAAAAEPADLYLGHCLAGLAAAGLAARRRGAKLGFDAEDFHRAENHDTPQPDLVALENHWIPACQHLTAASPLIAEAYAQACGVAVPPVLLNVFGLDEAPKVQAPPPDRPSLYWFSQTVGPGRGLEALVEALGLVRTPCDLHLRGLPAGDFPARLTALAHSVGFRGRLEFHPLANPASMISLAAAHTLGLSLEQSTPRNRDLCLTNKIFTYLLAGTPVLLTPTRAQQRLATDLGEAALVLNFDRPADTAGKLDAWLASPSRPHAAAHARALGLGRYNWDYEQASFLQTLRSALAKSAT